MPLDIQIRCINKRDRPNPHERILFVGGVELNGSRWKRDQQQAIQDLESGARRYWVHVRGKSVWVVVATGQSGHKYLKTEEDGEEQDNLLSLPECPA